MPLNGAFYRDRSAHLDTCVFNFIQMDILNQFFPEQKIFKGDFYR